MSEEILGKLRDTIIALDAEQARQAALEGISDGIDPLDMINSGIRAALELTGERFSSGQLFLPELMLAAKAADAAVKELEPELLKRGSSQYKLGKFLIATVKGDIHDIGKNIVALLMKSAGFEVFDIGVGKSAEEILDAAKSNNVAVIGLSALLTTTMPRMKEFIEYVEESGLRDKYKIIIGGAPTTQAFADMIGADGYASDSPQAVDLTKRLMGQ